MWLKALSSPGAIVRAPRLTTSAFHLGDFQFGRIDSRPFTSLVHTYQEMGAGGRQVWDAKSPQKKREWSGVVSGGGRF
jgi:hypothetical protein